MRNKLTKLNKTAVAVSGGVDSSFLLKCAVDVLGRENVLAVTAEGLNFPDWEIDTIKEIAKDLGVEHVLIDISNLFDEDFYKNDKNRCYFCKKKIFSEFLKISRQKGFETLIEGTNLDDLKDYRPGLKAIAELGVLSPLKDAKLTKKQIRKYSLELGLKTHANPSMACFATRIPYGMRICDKELIKVRDAEIFLRKLSFKQFRVRNYGDTARIEVELPEIQRFFNEHKLKALVIEKFKEIGFERVAIDLEGYKCLCFW